MTVFYLDPVNGNDSNDGTTFENRWKTIALGATAARIAPGDTIRIIKSPDAVDTGITGTFNSSSIITGDFSSAVSVLHDCSTNWTPSTNVTSVASTTNKIEGANSELITVSASFTTGLIAYTTVQADGAGFQQVSFMLRQNSGTLISDGKYSLNLYSDTSATSLIVSIPITGCKVLNSWWAHSGENASPFTSAQVKSVGIARSVNTGAIGLNIDNIIATTLSTDSKCLTHKHIVSESMSGPWYCLYNITPTAIQVNTTANAANLSATTQAGTVGVGDFTIKTRMPLYPPTAVLPTTATETTYSNVNEGGTLGNPITFSGGWSDVDGQTQTGHTYVCGVFCQGRFISIPYGVNYVNVERISPLSYYAPIYLGGGQNLNVSSEFVGKNQFGAIAINSAGTPISNVNLNVECIGSGAYGIVMNNSILLSKSRWIINKIVGVSGTGLSLQNSIASSEIIIQTVSNSYANNVSLGLSNSTLFIGEASYSGQGNSSNSQDSCVLNGVHDSFVTINKIVGIKGSANAVELSNWSNSSFRIGETTGLGASYNFPITNCSNLKIYPDGPFTPNNVIGVPSYLTGINGKIIFVNSSIPYSTNSGAVATVTYQNYGGDTTDQRTYNTISGNILTDNSTRHTPSGVSWKFTPSSNTTSLSKLTMPIGKVLLRNGVTTTVSVWIRRSSLSVTTGIECDAYQIKGIDSTIEITATDSINTWNQYSITLTPSEDGVVEIVGFAYCESDSGSSWFDDVSVS